MIGQLGASYNSVFQTNEEKNAMFQLALRLALVAMSTQANGNNKKMTCS